MISASLRLPPSLPLMSPYGLPAAGYPASARWHVISASLRLPPSLPLMSPYGLPAAGYPASARWHVFKFQVSGFQFPVSAPPPPRSPRLRVSPLLVALHVDSFAPAQLALRANLRLLYLASAPTLDSLFVISVSPWLINRPSLTPISKASATRVFVRFHRLRLHLRGSGSGHR